MNRPCQALQVAGYRCRSSKCGKTAWNFAATTCRVSSASPIPRQCARSREATGYFSAIPKDRVWWSSISVGVPGGWCSVACRMVMPPGANTPAATVSVLVIVIPAASMAHLTGNGGSWQRVVLVDFPSYQTPVAMSAQPGQPTPA
jgi:hypothetical protein